MRRTVAASVLVVVAAAGCGGTTAVKQKTLPSPSVTPADSLSVVHAAVAKATAARTFHVTMQLSMAPEGHRLTMSMTGDMDLARTIGTMHGTFASANIPNGAMSMNMIVTPSAFYMNMPLLSSELHGKQWLKIDLSELSRKSGINFQQLIQQSQQSNPAVYLQMLEASGDITVVGHETVDGVSTTHYSGTIPFDHFATNIPSALRAQIQRMAGQLGITAITMNAWIANDGLARRVTESFDTNFGQMTVQIDLSHYGEHVSITVPPAGEVTDLSALLAGH